MEQYQAMAKWSWSLCQWECEQVFSWEQVWPNDKQSCVLWDYDCTCLLQIYIALGIEKVIGFSSLLENINNIYEMD